MYMCIHKKLGTDTTKTSIRERLDCMLKSLTSLGLVFSVIGETCMII